MQSLVMRKHTILTVLKLIHTALLTNNLSFTGMANAPYLWIGFQQLLISTSAIFNFNIRNVIYYDNDFARHFFMIVSK